MGFSGAKIAPCPPYTPLGTIESSKGLRPSRALRGFFDSLSSPFRGAQAAANISLWFPNSSIESAAASGTGHCPAQNSGTSIYGSRFRRQNPRQQVAVGTADPGNARQPIRKEPCGFAEINRSNLWRLISSIEPAAATGTGHCPVIRARWSRRGLGRCARAPCSPDRAR